MNFLAIWDGGIRSSISYTHGTRVVEPSAWDYYKLIKIAFFTSFVEKFLIIFVARQVKVTAMRLKILQKWLTDIEMMQAENFVSFKSNFWNVYKFSACGSCKNDRMTQFLHQNSSKSRSKSQLICLHFHGCHSYAKWCWNL